MWLVFLRIQNSFQFSIDAVHFKPKIPASSEPVLGSGAQFGDRVRTKVMVAAVRILNCAVFGIDVTMSPLQGLQIS
jgi:hypothetical protein